MAVLTLTQNLISQGFEFPAGKTRMEVCDQQVKGLYLDVNLSAPNCGVFRLRYKSASGKTCHAPIGHSNDVTLDSARRAATLLKAQIAQGIFPNAAQKSKAEEVTWHTRRLDDLSPPDTSGNRCGVGCVGYVECFGKFSVEDPAWVLLLPANSATGIERTAIRVCSGSGNSSMAFSGKANSS